MRSVCFGVFGALSLWMEAQTAPSPTVCSDVRQTTAFYFPRLATSDDAQWAARRLCWMHEPSLDRKPGRRAVRCISHSNWNDFVTLVALSSEDCRLYIKQYKDGLQDAGALVVRAGHLKGCERLVEEMVSSLRPDASERGRSIGSAVVHPDAGRDFEIVVDGSSGWVFEWSDSSGHAVGHTRASEEPGTSSRAAVCEELLARANGISSERR